MKREYENEIEYEYGCVFENKKTGDKWILERWETEGEAKERAEQWEKIRKDVTVTVKKIEKSKYQA